MANRNFDDLKVLGKYFRVITGSFAPAGTGAPTALKGLGFGASVTRNSAGNFTLTFDDKFNDLIGGFAEVQMAAATDIKAQLGTFSQANKTLVIRTIAVATETDIAANANNRVHFFLVFKNSGVTP